MDSKTRKILETLSQEWRELEKVRKERITRLGYDDVNVTDSTARTNQLLWAIGVVINTENGISDASFCDHFGAARAYIESVSV